ncbi:hypothetical protein GCM10009547_19170 [Sporichthya brevicatena]|uniref:Uncharacterized protein n=2 Tax=Sporichthya brevicatena TaxID=171442 RepID=A0ABN1GRI0_9ACTN
MYLAGIGTRAADDPHGAAIRDARGVLTWSQLAEQLRGAAAALSALPPGARVGVTGENTVPTLITHLAGLFSGVGTVALHRQATAREFTHELTDTGCALAVIGEGSRAAISEAASDARVVVHPGPEWDAFVSTSPVELELAGRTVRPLLVFTSGTTGRAGATEVQWLRDPSITDARAYVEAVAAEPGFPDGPHLVVGPLQHNGPLTALRHLLAGRPVVVLPRFDAEEVLRQIAEHRVTSTVLVPTHLTRLLALAPDVRDRYDVSSLIAVAHTGSACPEHVKRAMIDWWGPVFTESYGGSEIGTVCRINSADWLAHPGSVGRAVPGLTIEAYDENGVVQPRGTTGVLGITLPPGRAIRFLGDEAKSARAYLATGVATLGDVGHVDDDGFVYITDRVSDMVVSGGVNLYPAECEQVLNRHPDVAEVAAIGVPHDDLGETLLALVVPARAGVDVADLDAFCRTELAGYKCPRSYELVTDLPRNDMGKLDKRALRKQYRALTTTR